MSPRKSAAPARRSKPAKPDPKSAAGLNRRLTMRLPSDVLDATVAYCDDQGISSKSTVSLMALKQFLRREGYLPEPASRTA